MRLFQVLSICGILLACEGKTRTRYVVEAEIDPIGGASGDVQGIEPSDIGGAAGTPNDPARAPGGADSGPQRPAPGSGGSAGEAPEAPAGGSSSNASTGGVPSAGGTAPNSSGGAPNPSGGTPAAGGSGGTVEPDPRGYEPGFRENELPRCWELMKEFQPTYCPNWILETQQIDCLAGCKNQGCEDECWSLTTEPNWSCPRKMYAKLCLP